MTAPVLQLANIRKSFGGVPALRGASLEVRAGEVHGLVGENGAGKSTLINIATGLFRPDAGAMTLNGVAVSFSSARQAAHCGISVVHQESDLFAQLSLAENMLLGRGLVRGPGRLIRWGRVYGEAERLIRQVGESFDVRAPAGGLTVARRMMAEIAAAVSEHARVLFLDEPTASLTQNEIKNLFQQIHRLKAEGVGIVYVSHRLEEVLELCDRVTILRDGEAVETVSSEDLTVERMVSAMVGREVSVLFEKKPTAIGQVSLKVTGVSAADGAFTDISLEAHRGEIVGIYGFVGAGRSEFAQSLFGLRPMKRGRIEVDGRPVALNTPGRAVRAGLAYLPEDRLVQGVFRGHSLRANASAAVLRRLSTLSWIHRRAETALARRVVSDMNVRASSIEQPIGTLSGGNQQKVVFGRWQATQPKVLLLDEPTRGVDVGAKAEIHKLISGMAEEGAAILMISSELPEIMVMSDRVITISEGRKTGEFNPRVDGEDVIAAAAVPRSTVRRSGAGNGRPGRLARWLGFREVGLLGFILALAAVMTWYKPSEFATVSNFLDVLSNAALPAIVAQGAMLIICAGGIDISVGSMLGLVSAVASTAAVQGAPPVACLALGMFAGTVLSLLNGGISLVAKIHPIIVTLAGLSIYRGLMRIAMGGREIMELPDAYRALANGDLFGVPKICYYVIFVTLAVHVLLRYTLPGRRVLALGNSQSAARLIGLSKTRLTLLVFAISGALVGLAAVLTAGYYGKVQANTGEGMELKAIAAAVIGGTNILGGRGSALGTLLGAFLVALLYNTLILAHASSYWQGSFVGALILVAVIVDMLIQRAQGAQS